MFTRISTLSAFPGCFKQMSLLFWKNSDESIFKQFAWWHLFSSIILLGYQWHLIEWNVSNQLWQPSSPASPNLLFNENMPSYKCCGDCEEAFLWKTTLMLEKNALKYYVCHLLHAVNLLYIHMSQYFLENLFEPQFSLVLPESVTEAVCSVCKISMLKRPLHYLVQVLVEV